jgi:predicted ATPase/DNA-binding SARP family transcriptional activator
MSRLRLLYLGPPHIELDGAPVTLSLSKAQALLAYLAVTGEAHNREALATLLWPESDANHARASLRGVLRELNATLGPPWIQADRTRVELNTARGVWLDVAAFEAAFEAAALRKAVDLYRDDFMAGFSLSNSIAFEEWQLFQEKRLRQRLSRALAQLSQPADEDTASLARALAHAQRWVALDPLSEAAHQQLIRLHLRSGQRTEALRQYEAYAQILERELGIAPSRDITELYWTPPDAVAPRPHPAVAPRPRAISPPIRGQHRGAGATRRRPPTLPAPLTPFVGRERERAEIGALLRGERPGASAACRLLTLVGPGGVGKTRLAIQVAHDVAPAFDDGVVFVPLDSVDYPVFLAPAIVEALGMSTEEENILSHLRRVLRDQHLLMVLDNFDYLLEGTGLLVDLLRAAPRVNMLVTSQEPLNLQGEWQIPVRGLPLPQDSDATWERNSAVQVFLQSARRAQASFSPSKADWPHIVRICRLVDGLPLGIELAAMWVPVLSCAEIAARIAESLEFLATEQHNVPARHRSLRAVFEHAWSLLSPQERRVFQRISVFVGGFRREAAEEVAGATLPLLRALMDRGLLRRQAGGRYDRHPLLWWYAAEKLGANPAERDAVRARHCAYYARVLEEQAARPRDVASIESDIDNVRAAWVWAHTQHPETDAAQALKAALKRFEAATGARLIREAQ